MANKRFPVSMNEELLEKLDSVCEEMCISRNGFINFLVANHIKQQYSVNEAVIKFLEENLQQIVAMAKEE